MTAASVVSRVRTSPACSDERDRVSERRRDCRLAGLLVKGGGFGLIGDDAMQAEGEAKQVQAQVMHAAGDLKDKAQEVASAVGDALHGLTGKRG